MTVTTCATGRWTTQRILFLMAGTVTLVGTVLGLVVSQWFFALPLLAGANQWLMVATGWCPMSLLLPRLGLGDARYAPEGPAES